MVADLDFRGVRCSGRRAAFVIASIALSLGCEPEPSLVLEQVSSIAFPDSFSATGVRSNRKGGFIAWARESGTIAIFDGPKSRSFVVDGALGVVGLGFDDQGVAEAMIESSGTHQGAYDVLLVSIPATALSTAVSVRVDARLLQAERSGSLWYMTTITPDSAIAVLRRDSAGGVQPIRIVRDVAHAGEGVRKLHLSADSSELLLTFADAPFTVERIDSLGRRLVQSAPLLDERVRIAIDSMPGAIWVSLPAVPLDRGYIQTIADLRSAQRILVLSGRDGNVVSARAFSVPLGFVESEISARRLCAVRTLDARELVCYRWQ